MKTKDPRLLVQPSPLLKQRMTTGQAMRDVLIALLPTSLAGIWYFGLGALLVLASAAVPEGAAGLGREFFARGLRIGDAKD